MFVFTDRRTLIQNTPNHKQKGRLSYRREKVVEHYSQKSHPTVQVVAESPMKEGTNILIPLL